MAIYMYGTNNPKSNSINATYLNLMKDTEDI